MNKTCSVSKIGVNIKIANKGNSRIKEKGHKRFGLTLVSAGALTEVDLPTQGALRGH